MSNTDTSGIAFPPRSRKCGFSDCWSARCGKYVLSERQKRGLYIHQKHICAQPAERRFYISLFCKGRIAFQKSTLLASTEQWFANKEVFCRCVLVSVVSISSTCVCAYTFAWVANTLRPHWSERHMRLAQSKPIDVYRHVWSKMPLPLQECVAIVYNAAAIILISL